MNSKKSDAVQKAESVFQDIKLECLEVFKSLEEIERINSFGIKRSYTIPTQVLYRFSYQWNGRTRHIDVLRKAGNSKPLTTNIRTEILKQLAEDLYEMEFLFIERKTER